MSYLFGRISGTSLSRDARLNVRVNFASHRGRAVAVRVAQAVNGKGTEIVRKALLAEKMETVHLLERVGTDPEVAYFGSDRNYSFRSRSSEIAMGDGIIFYEPSKESDASDERIAAQTEHRMWHIYLERAFPVWAVEVNKLFTQFSQTFSFLANGFHEPFTHFYVRAAALAHKSGGFALIEAKDELERTFWGMKKMDNGVGNVKRAGVYAGLMFSCVHPFRFWNEVARVGKWYETSIRQEAVESGFEDVFNEAQELSKEILESICLMGEDPKMYLLAEPIFHRWTKFIKLRAPSLLPPTVEH